MKYYLRSVEICHDRTRPQGYCYAKIELSELERTKSRKTLELTLASTGVSKTRKKVQRYLKMLEIEVPDNLTELIRPYQESQKN